MGLGGLVLCCGGFLRFAHRPPVAVVSCWLVLVIGIVALPCVCLCDSAQGGKTHDIFRCRPIGTPRTQPVGKPCDDGSALDAIALASVLTTGVVGLSATWGRSRELRWQSSEERTTELRAVLDQACEKLTAELVLLNQAYRELSVSGKVSPVTDGLLVEIERHLILAWNRVGVRRGAGTPEYAALDRCRDACANVRHLLDDMSTGGTPAQREAYSALWKAAIGAQSHFFDTASAALDSEGSAPFWRRRLRLSLRFY
jgi:hypothetical protein